MTEQENLKLLRTAIDDIDNLLMNLLDKRLDAVRLIGDSKKNTNTPIEDKSREDEIKEKISNFKNQKEISDIYETIFNVSKRIEEIE